MKKKYDFQRFKRDARILMIKQHKDYNDIAKACCYGYPTVAQFFSKNGRSFSMAMNIAVFLGMNIEDYKE